MPEPIEPLFTNPREAEGGNYAGPGGPDDMHGIVVEMTNAVLLDGTSAMVIHVQRGTEQSDNFGIVLEGRINQTQDRARVLYLTDLDGVVSVARQMHSLAIRAGVGEEFLAALDGGPS